MEKHEWVGTMVIYQLLHPEAPEEDTLINAASFGEAVAIANKLIGTPDDKFDQPVRGLRRISHGTARNIDFRTKKIYGTMFKNSHLLPEYRIGAKYAEAKRAALAEPKRRKTRST